MASKRSTLTSLVIIILLMIAAVVYWLFFYNKNSNNTSPESSTPKVSLVSIHKHTIPQTISSYGYSLSPNSVTVRSPASGIIQSIHFQSGQKVSKGQLLFVIQASDVTQQLNYLKPQLIAAKAAYERNLSANKKMPGIIAKQTLLSLKATYLQYLSQYKELYNQSHITAAINGSISDTNLAAGDLVSANDALASINTKNLIQVAYHLPSQWATKAKVGQSVHFINNDNQTFSGTVSYISPVLSANNQGVSLRANITNPGTLTANQFGQVIQIINPIQQLLAINQKLVQTDAKGYFVFGVKNNKVVNLYFTPGFVTKNGFITISSGLKEGDKMISDPSAVTLNQKVEVTHP